MGRRNQQAFPCGVRAFEGMTYREWLAGLIAAATADREVHYARGEWARKVIDLADQIILGLAAADPECAGWRLPDDLLKAPQGEARG